MARMGKRRADRRRLKTPDRSLLFPDRLKTELDAGGQDVPSGLDSSLSAGKKLVRPGTRKRQRKMERLKKKQRKLASSRKTSADRRIEIEPAATDNANKDTDIDGMEPDQDAEDMDVSESEDLSDGGGDYDDEDVPLEDEAVDAKNNGTQWPKRSQPTPSKTKFSTKKLPFESNNIHDLDREIAALEKKLGGDGNKLRKELDDDGLLDIYNMIDAPREEDPSSESELDSQEEESRREDIRLKTEKRKRKQKLLYGDAAIDPAISNGTYVPPHLRQSDSELHVRKGLTRTIVGSLNRLSESNLEPIMKGIKILFDDHPRGVLCDILSTSILQICLNFESIAPPIAASLGGLVAGLNVTLGSEIGAVFCERLSVEFQRCYAEQDSTKCLNLVKFLANLYTFQTITCLMIYDLIKMFIGTFSALDIELLLALVSSSGFQLRRDDPAALKEIILQIQGKTATPTPEAPQSRIDFMLDMIYDLKNNKQRMSHTFSGQIEALRNWLRQTFPNFADSQLRFSWTELINCGKTGRWWMVGSAWKDRSMSFGGNKSAENHIQAIVEQHNNNDLLKLAKARRMNTDIRRAVFCVIMSAADYLDAFEKLIRLSLRPHMDKDVTAVILDCCSNEKAWNPYYAYLSGKVCSFQRSYRYTFQLVFCDVFKAMSDRTPRQLSNLAHLLAHLVTEFYISLSHLKVVDFLSMDGPSTLFFLVLFKTIMKAPRNTLGAIFQRISALPQLQILRDSIIVFLHRHLAGQNFTAEINFVERCMVQNDAHNTI